MRDKPNKPQHRDLIRGKGLTRGLSLEDMSIGYISTTKDMALLNNEGLSNGQ